MSERILITSALPYVNNIPHLGNIIGCVLPADVIARYHRLKRDEVLFVCGADEYGTAAEIKAREQNMTPRELCDKYYEEHQKIYKWFNISFDIFGRTSTTNPRADKHYHTEISQKIFSQLYHNGFLEEREITQLFCPTTNMFVADNFVIGTCPKCGDTNANGDQCEKCHNVYESIDLIDPHLKNNGPLELRQSKHLFLRLDLLQPKIEEWFNSIKHKWAANAIIITEKWLEKGLKPRCITRDMEWGTPIPDDVPLEGKETKVIYNWFDAPIGYISIAGDENINWWKSEIPCRLIQFMGIDNVFFHSILFPGCLMGTNETYNLVTDLSSSRYLNYEGRKFSKSQNHGIFCNEVMSKNIHPDYWRYYLMKIRPEDSTGDISHQREDANFNFKAFVDTCNADLCGNIGNLIHRVFNIAHKYFNGVITNCKLQKRYSKTIEFCDSAYQEQHISSIIQYVLCLANDTNKYLTQSAPWKLDQSEPRIKDIIAESLCSIWDILKMLEPIMPETITHILSFYNFDENQIVIKDGFKPFFPKVNM